MAISNALTIGKRGLRAAETALAVTAQNIANAVTPGYSRQVVELEADPPLLDTSGVLLGSGVHVDSVRQAVDPLLDRRLLTAGTARREAGARSGQLGTLAGIVNDVDDPSLATALNGFFDAADALARNPGGLAERQTFLARAGTLTAEVNRRSAAIASLQRAADDRLETGLNEANGLLQQIRDLNTEIVRVEAGDQQANDLRDQRTQALSRLGGLLGVSATEEPNGALTVSASNGVVLVSGTGVVTSLGTQPAAAPGLDGRAVGQLGIVTPGGFTALPATYAQGELGALAAVRDGEIADASTALDTFALALRDGVNAIQTDRLARDLDGNATTAAPIFDGTGAANLAVVLTDPRRVGAALSTELGDNRNALAFADLRGTPQTSLGSLTFAAYLGSQQAIVGEEAARASDTATASDLLHEQVENERLSLSGVNLNEELTNLLKYQRAYQAAARVISVNDGVLEDLMRIV